MPAPVQRVSTHPGIRIDKIPVSDATGLIFAIGSVAIFLTLPAVRWFAVFSLPVGLLVAALLRLTKRSKPQKKWL